MSDIRHARNRTRDLHELAACASARDESGRGALRSDLYVKGLKKPQVFGRIEELEAREDLPSEFVPAMEA
jgi:hypothetical protein